MEFTKEEKLTIQGFRNGYTIASKSKKLQEQILKLHHNSFYLKGLIKGIEECQRHLDIISPALSKLQKRKALLKNITEQDKEELER